jgi:hypothetical protein
VRNSLRGQASSTPTRSLLAAPGNQNSP